MKTDKTTEGASTSAENIDEQPLVLKSDWLMDKPKEIEKTHSFSVTFNENTKKIDLTVNGEVYRIMSVRDKLSGMRKFHEAVAHLVTLFSDWGFYENRN